MRIGDYVIAARGETLPQVHGFYGGLESAVGRAREIAGGKREWAVFVPADRANTAGTMLVRGHGRRVRWFPAGREAAGLPQWDQDVQDTRRACPACAGTGWLPLGPSPGVYAVECALCADKVAS